MVRVGGGVDGDRGDHVDIITSLWGSKFIKTTIELVNVFDIRVARTKATSINSIDLDVNGVCMVHRGGQGQGCTWWIGGVVHGG
jgi:hypothetical protein